MNKLKVFIVGHESKNNNAVSGFIWNLSEKEINNHHWELLKEYKGSDQAIYKGSIELDLPTPTIDSHFDDITKIVESFLEENNWEESFNK